MEKMILTNEEIAAIFLKQRWQLAALALSYVDSASAADEIVSDAIVAILEAPAKFETEAACACYLRSIVRNKSVSYLRRKYEIVPEEGQKLELYLTEKREHDLPYREAELQVLLDEVLSKYSQEVREAFIAHVLDDETIPDLAALYGIKNDTLRKQFQRIKQRICRVVPKNDMRMFLFVLLLYP